LRSGSWASPHASVGRLERPLLELRRRRLTKQKRRAAESSKSSGNEAGREVGLGSRAVRGTTVGEWSSASDGRLWEPQTRGSRRLAEARII
jgi:hypothetical protein